MKQVKLCWINKKLELHILELQLFYCTFNCMLKFLLTAEKISALHANFTKWIFALLAPYKLTNCMLHCISICVTWFVAFPTCIFFVACLLACMPHCMHVAATYLTKIYNIKTLVIECIILFKVVENEKQLKVVLIKRKDVGSRKCILWSIRSMLLNLFFRDM